MKTHDTTGSYKESIFSTLFDATHDPMLIEQNKVFTGCNDAAVDLLGLDDKEQITRMNPARIWSERQPNGQRSSEGIQTAREAADTKGSHRFEWNCAKLDGTPFWADITLTVVGNATAVGDATYIAVLRNITHRKNYEKQLLQDQIQFKALFEESPDPITLMADGIFISCNKAAVEALEVDSKDGIIGKGPAEFSPEFQPDGQPSMEKALKQIEISLKKGRYHFEWMHKTAKGREIWFEIGMTQTMLDGRPVLYNVWRDITARKESEQRIREQAQAIGDLSTPVVKLWDGIVMLPMVGVMDTARSRQMTERVLEAVAEEEARVAILDVTGVAMIDTAVARHLIETVAAVRILGADVVMTGFSPEAAQTLAQLGVDFTGFRTRGSLRAGVEEALAIIGGSVSNN